jgi:hypothetical protein
LQPLPPTQESSLKDDDAFVLDAGATIFVYHGSGCNVREKMKAMQVRGLGVAGRGWAGGCGLQPGLVGAGQPVCCGGCT